MLRLLSTWIALTIGFGSFAAGASPEGTATHQGIDKTGMDPAVKPYQDFYQYANGQWLARTPIPADRAIYAMFTVLQDRNREVLHGILEEASKDKSNPESIAGKVGTFYRTGMDEARIEAAGAKPLQEEFDRIDKLASAADLPGEVAHLHELGVSAGFRMGPHPDLMNSKQMIAGLSQGGLGLPDRDYYLKKDPKTEEIRNAYRAHIEKMLCLYGDAAEKARAEAQVVLDLETRLAKASKTRVELRDPKANYHLMALDKLTAEAPGFAWSAYCRGLRLEGLREIDIGQPGFCQEIGRTASEVPIEQWKAYLRWHLLDHYANALSAAFEKENFHFHGTVLTGVPQMEPRWQRVEEATDHLLGEALGQLYVARAFPPEARTKAEALVNNVRAALRDRLANLEWMSPATRKEAIRKLDAIAVKVGYPSKWRDYSGLHLKDDVYVVNVMKASAYLRRQQLGKIGKPVDRGEWGMTPPTVNAYYNSSHNEIVFPAGILQPPFFDPKADDAVNYGGIGMVIGHELTHGFDDQGRQFDADGNLRDWWTPEDEQRFKARAAEIVKQYDGYTVLDGLHVNGKLTLGENIADLGGLKIAYMALQKTLQGKPAPKPIDGFTAEQRYFLSFAQLWRYKIRPEAQRVRIATDPHSPPRYRVLGPLYNMPVFFQVFGATPAETGDRLNSKPVEIW